MRAGEMVRLAGVLGLAAAVTLGLVACQVDSTGLEYVDRLIIEPDSVHLEPGESATFTVTPLGPRDQHYPERVGWVEWSLVNPDVADMELTGLGATVTVKEVGEARVEATLGRGTGVGSIFVRPSGLAAIEIVPSPLLASPAEFVRVRARLLDASGAELSPDGFRISWRTDDQGVATVSQAREPVARISTRSPGRTRLHLVVGPMRVSTDLVVEDG